MSNYKIVLLLCLWLCRVVYICSQRQQFGTVSSQPSSVGDLHAKRQW